MKNRPFPYAIARFLFIYWLFLTFTGICMAQQTRGIGIYPGNPEQYFGPEIIQDGTLRNIALQRAVYQSGAHDLNLTAQLLTDGVIEKDRPAFLNVLANGKSLPANERELTINDSEWSHINVAGSNATLEYLWSNMDIEADEIVVEGFVAYNQEIPFPKFNITCETIGKDKTLSILHKSDTLPGRPRRRMVASDPNKQTEEPTAMAREIKETFNLQDIRTFQSLKFTFCQNNALYWSIKEVTFKKNGKAIHNILPAQYFCSVWKAPKGTWAYMDLGAVADISEVKLHWIDRPVHNILEISNDAITWKPFVRNQNLHSDNQTTIQSICAKAQARYIRITVEEDTYLSEIEVFGKNGVIPIPHPEQGWNGRKFMLNGGNWTLCPVNSPLPSKARATGPEIIATVPATVLSSYYNAGALPAPNFDDNLSMISESFFNRDFLYKRSFHVPSDMRNKKKHVFLNFDGINWKARIVLNDREIGQIKGAFTRAQFDITDLIQDENRLCVYIEKNANPGARKTKTMNNTGFNGGVLGGDNPTFHATIGWDWITTIPGRDIGIWNDVYLTATDAVTISDPFVSTTLKQGKATMVPSVFLRNHLDTTFRGTLHGFIGKIHFEKSVSIAPKSEKEVTFSPADFPQLTDKQMKLWWPNGYGEPVLYDAKYVLLSDTRNSAPMPPKIMAVLDYKTGIREVTYSDEKSRLQLFINGQRFIPLGGNWGFSENHLNYRGREYDIAVDYHKQMNFNMIRNWVGQTGDEEFYEACDRHGIMVWQDFWLANPADGPDPNDEDMFMDNARDYVRRIRQHPSIALYCGRNEGYPPASLNGQLADLLKDLYPDALYIPSSADDGVSGHGPYRALPVKEYFELQTGKLHSERGMPNVPSHESLCRMLDPLHLWPRNEYWGKHDFTQQGAQYGTSFNELILKRFGPNAISARRDISADEMFCRLAQWQNYDGYRAMFESANVQRQGLIIWMSHSCWPSMVWQTYDYFFEPTAAFFGIKKACEPIHIQYNEARNTVQLINLMQPSSDVSVTASIYDLKGNCQWMKKTDLTIPSDFTMDCFEVEAGNIDGNTHILRLEAVSGGNCAPISTNDYILWGSGTHADLWQIPETSVDIENANPTGNELTLKNTGTAPALMIRLNLCAEDGEQILPVEYSDNYFHLLPGEQKQVKLSWNANDARNLQAVLKISGFNLKNREFHLATP